MYNVHTNGALASYPFLNNAVHARETRRMGEVVAMGAEKRPKSDDEIANGHCTRRRRNPFAGKTMNVRGKGRRRESGDRWRRQWRDDGGGGVTLCETVGWWTTVSENIRLTDHRDRRPAVPVLSLSLSLARFRPSKTYTYNVYGPFALSHSDTGLRRRVTRVLN